MSVDKQRLGILLDEMIRTLSARQHRAMSEIMGRLSEHLSVKPDAVYKWRQGIFVPRDEAVAYLAQVGATEAGMDRAWANEVLTLTGHPDRTALLARLFPLAVALQPSYDQVQQVQHNLPHPQHRELYGRECEKAAVLERLAPASRYGIVPVVGPTGIGKTALALEIAWQLVDPGEQTSVVSPAQAIAGTFDAFFYASASKRMLDMRDTWDRPAVGLKGLRDLCITAPETLLSTALPGARALPDIMNMDEQVTALMRSLRQSGRVLLILDDLDALAEVEIRNILNVLRDVPATTKVIVTARMHQNLPWPIKLEHLDREALQRVLDDESRAHLVSLAPSAYEHLIDAAEGSPLVVKWFFWRMILDSLSAEAATRWNAPYNRPLREFLGDSHSQPSAASPQLARLGRSRSTSAVESRSLSRTSQMTP